MNHSGQVTQLLLDWSEGDKAALDKLIPIVHDELRRLARNYMRRERAGHTLQTSALINEAYLRLADGDVAWKNRSHFFGIAARLMRQILVDHARALNNLKRGGDQLKVSLSEAAGIGERAAELIALDEALENLAALDEQQSRIVELRYFSGLTIEETADLLSISTATVEREWRSARAWLRHQMTT
jgi:RNA polymerase sigma-70 factor, ECF subfamily